MSNIGRKVKIINGESSVTPLFNTVDVVGQIGEVINIGGGALFTIQLKNGDKKKVWSPECSNRNECIWYNEPEYTIEAIKGKNIAVHCSSQEEYDLVCPILNGKENRLLPRHWETYRERTTIQWDENGGSYADDVYYKRKKYEIISAQTFLTANNIKTMTATEKKIKELEDQLNELKESLKAPQYKVGDWVFVHDCRGGIKEGTIEKLNRYDGTDWWIDSGCVNKKRFRPATPEEIATASKVKVTIGDWYVIKNTGSFIGGDIPKSGIVKLTHWKESGKNIAIETQYINKERPLYKCYIVFNNSIFFSAEDDCINPIVRPATPEEIAAATKVKVTIGDAGKEVTIEKGKITAHDGTTVEKAQIDILITMMAQKKLKQWDVKFHTVDVGCVKNITLAQLQKVQEEYKRLNP